MQPYLKNDGVKFEHRKNMASMTDESDWENKSMNRGRIGSESLSELTSHRRKVNDGEEYQDYLLYFSFIF